MFLSFLASIILMGAPGSGKGSFAEEYVAKHPDILHFSIGDWIRSEISKDSALGKKIKEELKKESFLQNGCLLDDEFIEEIVVKKLTEIVESGKQFILDGFPRNFDQALFVEKFLNNKADFVFLKIDLKCAKDRMQKRGRSGDTEKMIEDRMAAYSRVTEPAIQYFIDKGIVIEIDALLLPKETVECYEKAIRNKS